MPYSGDRRGALWRKWDLHVHTPDSYEHEFGNREDPATWDRYINALAGLPSEIEVLGINDYFSIEGYRKVRVAWQNGRLPNIKLLLPVVEIRLDHLAGNKETQRLNYHVIFSDEVPIEEIERSFLHQLTIKFGDFDGCIGHVQGMTEYGRAIKASVPAAKAPSGSDPKVGFQHAFVSLERVTQALARHVFRGRTLRALGYSEWSAMRWEGGGGAIKREISDQVDFFLGCSAVPSDHHRHLAKLREDGVTSRLLDASDAHRYAEDEAVDRRLGATMTWLKADPTFEGLRRAIQRYDERVFVGDEPDQLTSIRTQQNRFIRSVSIHKNADSDLNEVWFDLELPVNPGLVAIIGNQGSGKSALTDCMALAGNADTEHFSFLTEKRFCHPRTNKASNFSVTLTWENGEQDSRLLTARRDNDRRERVRYVPQQFFDLATNETDMDGAKTLYGEIEKAVFSHIPVAQRQDCRSFRELVELRTRLVDERLGELRNQLRARNAEIARLEEETAKSARARIRTRIADRRDLIEQVTLAPPVEAPAPPQDEDTSVEDALRVDIERLTAAVEVARQAERNEFSRYRALEDALIALERLQEEAERRRDEIYADLGPWADGITANSLMSISADTSALQARSADANAKVQIHRTAQDPESLGTAAQQLAERKVELTSRTQALSAVRRAYENYKTELQSWEDRLRRLRSDPQDGDALDVLEATANRLEHTIPERLAELRQERKEVFKLIHTSLAEKLQIYRELAEHVQTFLRDEELTREHYQLDFDLALTPVDVVKEYFQYVKHQGALYGSDEARAWVGGSVQACDFGDVDSVLTLVDELTEKVVDGRNADEERWECFRSMVRAGRTLPEFYDWAYGLSVLIPQYRLALRGRPIEQLSPGERGILLLIFYLIVDKSDLPLIIDQPEGNLNNQSIYEHLVPVIRRAKQNRQIVMVSHNPNIVVGCDADQIVHASMEPADGYRTTYLCGALEHPDFRDYTVDKLEGTRPAFHERAETYTV